MIEPLGKRVAVYLGVHGWTACYFITDSAPTQAAAQLAAEAFGTAYSAGWIDALRDVLQLWREAKAVDAAGWNVRMFGEWLRGAVNRLAPGAPGWA